MKYRKIPFQDIPYFSTRDLAYYNHEESLSPFVQFPFNYQAFSDVIESRKKFPVDREILYHEVKRQYASLPHNSAVLKNIKLLKEDNTFTLITAHQPSLFTGPFYFILKICSVINLSKRLTKDYPNYNFVPVFIIGGEDHDFEEVNHTYVFGKKITWDRQVSGPVGRLDLEGLDKGPIQELSNILGDSLNAKELRDMVTKSYEHAKTYGEFTHHLTHTIFKKYGLVVVSFDNVAFKKRFTPIIKREIFEQFSKEHVEKTQTELELQGYASQAHARDINFFYFYKNKRNRLVYEDHKYHALETDQYWTAQELEALIDEHPERFSPNVVTRPLFQEMIMPNLAYIGGGGELAYWMERKSQFKNAGVFYPMLIRRNSAMYISHARIKTLYKLDLRLEDMLGDVEHLIREYALKKSHHDINLNSIKDQLSAVYARLNSMAQEVDKSLVPKVEAMKTNELKNIDKIETRMIRTIKSNQEIVLNKIRKLKADLFPNNGLQERKANFMEFYLTEGSILIDQLVEICDPFERGFLVLESD